MSLHDELRALEESAPFRAWDRGGYYLVHYFEMSGQPPQFGYYPRDRKKMVCFELKDEPVMLPESDVFREDEGPLKALDLGQVFVGIADARNNASKLSQDRYPHETIDRDILILQNTDEGPIYTITLITRSIRMINIRMSAESGEVKNYEMHSLMDLGEPLS